MAEIKDETLAARAAKGDMQAFEDLVNRHRTFVYRLARSITGNHDDADDAAQETFIRVHRSLSSFDTGRSFRPWLRRIAYNTSLNVLRGVTNRKKRIGGTETDHVPDLAPDPEQAAQNRDSRYHIKTAVDSLTVELRATIVLRASEGMSYQDIAKTTGVKIGTVMSRLSRARERIQASMEAGGKLEQGGDVS